MYSTTTSCPCLGMNWAPKPLSAHCCLTRTQQESSFFSLALRSHGKQTWTCPRALVVISSPSSKRPFRPDVLSSLSLKM